MRLPSPLLPLLLLLLLLLAGCSTRRSSPALAAFIREHDIFAGSRVRVAMFRADPLVGPPLRRGMVAAADIEAGDLLLRVPGALLMTREAALGDAVLGPILRPLKQDLPQAALLATYLIHQTHNAGGRFHRWATSLPGPPPGGLNLCCTDALVAHRDRLDSLVQREAMNKYSMSRYIFMLARRGYNGTRETFERLDKEVFSAHRDVFPAHQFGFPAYLWAVGLVRSRSFSVYVAPNGTYQYKPTNGSVSLSALVPVADRFNHAPQPSVSASCANRDTSSSGNSESRSESESKTESKTDGESETGGDGDGEGQGSDGSDDDECYTEQTFYYGYNETDATFTIRANQRYSVGDEVTISYGDLTSEEMLSGCAEEKRREEGVVVHGLVYYSLE